MRYVALFLLLCLALFGCGPSAQARIVAAMGYTVRAKTIEYEARQIAAAEQLGERLAERPDATHDDVRREMAKGEERRALITRLLPMLAKLHDDWLAAYERGADLAVTVVLSAYCDFAARFTEVGLPALPGGAICPAQ